MDEESASKRLNPAQEMSIPLDLDDKLGCVASSPNTFDRAALTIYSILRAHIPSLLTSYQKLVTLAERSLVRLQSASADASRFALSLQTLGEEIPVSCWRCAGGGKCGLCGGIGRGLGDVGEAWSGIGGLQEKRVSAGLVCNASWTSGM
jgi:sorting nexin-8